MFEVLSWPLFTMFLALLTPTASFAAQNKGYYTRRQIVNSLLLMSLIGLAGGALLTLLYAATAETWPVLWFQDIGIDIRSAVICAVALLCFFVLSERFFSLMPARYRKTIMFGIFAALVLISAFFSLLPFNILLGGHLFLSFLDARKPATDNAQPLFSEKTDMLGYSSDVKRNKTLVKKPNIYFVLLESCHSEETLRELYRIDDSATTRLFAELGFVNYDNVYSNTSDTRASLYNILSGELFGEYDNNLFALDILRENGYSCEFFDFVSYVFGNYVADGEYASFSLSRKTIRLYQKISPILGQSKYIQRLTRDNDPFETATRSDEVADKVRLRLKVKSHTPRCFFIRVGATHFRPQIGTLAEPFEKTYINSYAANIPHVHTVIQSIREADPNGLVIALGDHGAKKFGSFWSISGRKAFSDALKNGTVSARQFAVDTFSVRAAVYWPEPYKIEQPLSHVNIFRYVFDFLSDGQGGFLEDRASDISVLHDWNILHDWYILVRDGQILENPEPYTPPVDSLQKKFAAGTLLLDEHLHLADLLKTHDRAQAINVLEHAAASFPPNPAVLSRLSTLYLANFDLRAVETAEALMRLAPADERHKARYINTLAMTGFGEKALLVAEKEGLLFSPGTFANLIHAAASLGRWDVAENIALRVAEMDRAHEPLSCGFVLRYMKDSEKAKEIFQLNDSKEHKGHWLVHEGYGLLRALLFLDAGELRLAEQAYAEIFHRLHFDVWSVRIYSYILEAQGKTEEAIAVLAQAMGYDRSFDEGLAEALGFLCLRQDLNKSVFHEYRKLGLKKLKEYEQIINRSAIFDADWYRSQQNLPARVNAAQHYLLKGACKGERPAPWFDPFYYIFKNYPMVQTFGQDPFVHFIQFALQKNQAASPGCVPSIALTRRPLEKGLLEALRRTAKSWSAGSLPSAA